MNKRGIFITIEGGDGSGKTTMVKKLSKLLEEKCPDREIKIYREPDYTTIYGREIKKYMEKNMFFSLPHSIQMSLMIKSSIETRKEIKKDIENGSIVICDRGCLSTYIYQIKKCPSILPLFNTLVNMIDIFPDYLLVMNLPYAVCCSRINRRGDNFNDYIPPQHVYDSYNNVQEIMNEKGMSFFSDKVKTINLSDLIDVNNLKEENILDEKLK